MSYPAAAREAGTVGIWQRGTDMLCLAKMNCDSFFEVGHIAAPEQNWDSVSKELEGNGCRIGN